LAGPIQTKTAHGGTGDVINGDLPAYRISSDGKNKLTIEINAGLTNDFWGERNMKGPFGHFTSYEKSSSGDLTRYIITTKGKVAFKVQEKLTTFESLRVVFKTLD
jgi:Cu/Zn superoxide dismutase